MTKYGLLVVNNKARKESILHSTEGACKGTIKSFWPFILWQRLVFKKARMFLVTRLGKSTSWNLWQRLFVALSLPLSSGHSSTPIKTLRDWDLQSPDNLPSTHYSQSCLTMPLQQTHIPRTLYHSVQRVKLRGKGHKKNIKSCKKICFFFLHPQWNVLWYLLTEKSNWHSSNIHSQVFPESRAWFFTIAEGMLSEFFQPGLGLWPS